MALCLTAPAEIRAAADRATQLSSCAARFGTRPNTARASACTNAACIRARAYATRFGADAASLIGTKRTARFVSVERDGAISKDCIQSAGGSSENRRLLGICAELIAKESDD